MEIKLFDSELKVMEVLWERGESKAGELVKILKEETGWNRNTTYTVIKKLVSKGAIERIEPNFVCKALISKEEVQKQETETLINKMFGGSSEKFLSAFINKENLSSDEITKLKQIVEKLE
ncbi:TPA: BlaI/MecI/CopY family transcriptional regulator [Clostridioides difficile]|nr:BlaI/MecI/CopY family transcriptional regulator [Clostridioides difficile]HBF5837606.1 BlaI/MecI/CopY family transcriptional regulator [Clostridioides difficile]